MEDYACRPAFPDTLQVNQETPCSAKTTTAKGEQPVYEQLMPAAVVPAVANSYEHPTEVAQASGVAGTALHDAANGTEQRHKPDAFPSSVTAALNPLENSAQCQPLEEPPVVDNGPATDCTTKILSSNAFSDATVESTVCNGVSQSNDETPKSVDSHTTETSAVTPDCASDRPDHVVDKLNDKSPTKEPVFGDAPESRKRKDTDAAEAEPSTCNQANGDCLSKDQASKDDELPCRTENVDKHEEGPPTIADESQPVTKEDEQLDESHHDEDENDSDTVLSDEDTPNTDNVFSLFKNVVLVQADSLAGEDSEGPVTSAAGSSASGDEEQTEPIVTGSVEDIGREEGPEQDAAQLPAGLFIDETDDVQNYEMMEPGRKTSMDVETDSLSSDGGASKGRSQKCQLRKRGRNRVAYEENGEEDEEKKKLRRCKDTAQRNANDDPFDSCSNSSSEDVPNDMYFGASDRVYTVSTKLHWQRQKQKDRKRYARSKGKSLEREDEEQSSDSEEEEERVRRRAKKAEEIARLKLPAYQQQQLHQMVLKKHPKRDRFYDRSQDIPNDIYFGNVNVPLHILHASSSSSSDEAPWVGGSVKLASHTGSHQAKHRKTDYVQCTKSSSAHSKSSSYRNYRTSSPRSETASNHGGIRSLYRMKEYLKMAGFRHMRYQKLWQGCETNHDRAEAILRFLQEHGLQGEPTDEKCRELRKQIQLQKEVEVLDTSVIIGGGEGRVTRQRAKKVSESSTTEVAINSLPDQSVQSEADAKSDPTSTETVKEDVQSEQLSTALQEQTSKHDEEVGQDLMEQSVKQISPDGEPLNG